MGNPATARTVAIQRVLALPLRAGQRRLAGRTSGRPQPGGGPRAQAGVAGRSAAGESASAAADPAVEPAVVVRWCFPTLRVRREAFASALEHARSAEGREVIGLLVRLAGSTDRLATEYLKVQGAECSATSAGVPGQVHRELAERLRSEGRVLVGFVHSHPRGSSCRHSTVDETFVREFLPSFAEHGRLRPDLAPCIRVGPDSLELGLPSGRWCRYRLVGPPVQNEPETREPRRWLAPQAPTFSAVNSDEGPIVADDGERLRVTVDGASFTLGIPHDAALVREELAERERSESALFSLVVTPDGKAAAGALLILPPPLGCEPGGTLQLFGPAPLQLVGAEEPCAEAGSPARAASEVTR